MVTTHERMLMVLRRKVPGAAIDFALQLWVDKPFEFSLKPSRKSKLGDFRLLPDHSYPLITVNANLNPYRFLMTYVHEVAHWYAVDRHGKNIPPHGKQWKDTFQKLMIPVLDTSVWPESLLKVLVPHMINPKASSGADARLEMPFKSFDEGKEGVLNLMQLKAGAEFLLRGRRFRKEQNRRTRALCCEVMTGRKYLVPLAAEIQLP
jgi:hypothetical protein